jgi:hypothetical protein
VDVVKIMTEEHVFVGWMYDNLNWCFIGIKIEIEIEIELEIEIEMCCHYGWPNEQPNPGTIWHATNRHDPTRHYALAVPCLGNATS